MFKLSWFTLALNTLYSVVKRLCALYGKYLLHYIQNRFDQKL